MVAERVQVVVAGCGGRGELGDSAQNLNLLKVDIPVLKFLQQITEKNE